MNVKKLLLWRAHSNFQYNRRYWNLYARTWSLRKRLGIGEVGATDGPADLIGDEWGEREDVLTVIDEYILPYVLEDSVVGEIGTGGARLATKVAPHAAEFHCFDIAAAMLRAARHALSDHNHVRYHLLRGPVFPDDLAGRFDFIYSFDVFPHLDLHTIWKYLQAVSGMLKPDGRAFLHTSNLGAPDGWRRFAGQDHFSVEGHYFVTPEIVKILVDHSDFRIIKESSPDPNSFYQNRDYLFVLEKK